MSRLLHAQVFEPVRNPDCGDYLACLSLAAHNNAKMRCRGCPNEHDLAGKLTADNFNQIEFAGCLALMTALWFTEPGECEKNGNPKTF